MDSVGGWGTCVLCANTSTTWKTGNIHILRGWTIAGGKDASKAEQCTCRCASRWIQVVWGSGGSVLSSTGARLFSVVLSECG